MTVIWCSLTHRWTIDWRALWHPWILAWQFRLCKRPYQQILMYFALFSWTRCVFSTFICVLLLQVALTIEYLVSIKLNAINQIDAANLVTLLSAVNQISTARPKIHASTISVRVEIEFQIHLTTSSLPLEMCKFHKRNIASRIIIFTNWRLWIHYEPS